MPVPDFESVMLPLLRLLADGEPRPTSELIEQVADVFNLSPVERSEMLASGTRRIASNVGWARTDLGKAGLIRRVARGTWQITDEGTRVLNEAPDRLTRRYLSTRYPEHAAYTRRVPIPAQSGADVSTQASIAEASSSPETPEEAIDRAHSSLQVSLGDELLERIKANSPAFFERLVVQLLLAMGYGGLRSDAGLVLGRSGDGGIDGVINEDKLGLDSIYIQAKRWEGTVGRPVVQAFVGSLVGQPAAAKGVLMTTGMFSQDARQYARGLPMRVVLVDGPMLAGLMVEHGVGVTVVSTYHIRRVDSDYFLEE